MKRFYKSVTMEKKPGGYSILLDGKPVKTLARNLLQTPYKNLAAAIMQEWAGQGEKIVMDSMPLTQLLGTCIDRIGNERPEISAAVMKYLDTDLLCYRVALPPEMAACQAKMWDPWLEWFGSEFAPLLTTTDLRALIQPAAAHKKAQDFIKNLDDDRFNILQLVTSLSGSLVLALAFVKKTATARQVFDAAHAEENYKAELHNEKQYGSDPAQEKKDKAVFSDLEAAGRYLDLIS